MRYIMQKCPRRKLLLGIALLVISFVLVFIGVGFFLNSDHEITGLLATEYCQSGFTYIELKRNGGEICITSVTDLSKAQKIPSKIHDMPVTEIAEDAFENCTSLESIEFPDSLAEIGASAFENCSNLKSIEFPDILMEIGERAFALCNSLEQIKIPSNITEINSGLFFFCSSLEKVSLPDHIKKIRDYAFYGCIGLNEVKIIDSVTEIDNYAFYGCTCLSFKEIPDSVRRIGEMAFDECMELDSVVISSKTKCAKNAFPEWTKITIIN